MSDSAEEALRVDIISDVVCPWCIIGYSQLKAAADAIGIVLDVQWHPYELNPNMPPEGQNLREHISEKYGTSAEESATTREVISRYGQEFDFSFNFTPESRIVNTLQAHKLIKWAKSKGAQHDLKMTLFRLYFTEGEDVSEVEVLLEAVDQVGLDVIEAQRVLEDDIASNDIRDEEHRWRSKGVQAVPSMVFEEKYLVTGAQGVENYKSIIEQLSRAKVA